MNKETVFSQLKETLVSVGISPELAEEYVWFTYSCHQTDAELGRIACKDCLPGDECLRTLEEAQRIVAESSANKINPRELNVLEIHRYLGIPDTQWKKAKGVIAEFFQRKEKAVDALFHEDEGWLLKTAQDCLDVALYLKSICFFDTDLAWKVFRHAGLLGIEETEKRITALFELMGPEDSLLLIRQDLVQNCWLFCQYDHIDPVGCIAYLKQCELSTAEILELLEHDGYILYLFGKKTSQARIDAVIKRHSDQWEYDRWYAHEYKNLSPEDQAFLRCGPGKLEG